jgi:hypothetical protein
MEKREESYVIFVQIPRTASNSVIHICKRQKFSLIIKSHHPVYIPVVSTSNSNILNLDECEIDLTLLNIQSSPFYNKFTNVKSFSIVRDPYTRILSVYKFLKNGGTQSVLDLKYKKILDTYDSFSSCLLDIESLKKEVVHFVPQYIYVCNSDDQICIDNILKFENLQEDLLILDPSLKLDIHIYSSKDLPINLSEDDKNKIYDAYLKDFTIFNYQK